jgi:hypothetical protein
MKTLREYIEILDEISRRDFLKGAGATAGLAAIGAPKDAKADWWTGSYTDNLTGGKSTFMNNPSTENPNIQLSMRNWPNAGGYVLVMLGFPQIELRGSVVSFGSGMEGIKTNFRAMVGNKVFNGLEGILMKGANQTMFVLAVQNRFNPQLFRSIVDSSEDDQGTADVAVEVGSQVYHFKGRYARPGQLSPAPIREQAEVLVDELTRILEIAKHK